jgi:hypothetical protein
MASLAELEYLDGSGLGNNHYNTYDSYARNDGSKPFETAPQQDSMNTHQEKPVYARQNVQQNVPEVQHFAGSGMGNGGGNDGGGAQPAPSNGDTQRLEKLNQQLSTQIQQLNDIQTNRNSGGFLDSYMAKRREIAKVFLMALIVVLGLSLNKVVEDYFVDIYLVDLEAEFNTKLLLRILYPALIILLIWTMKVSFR